MPRGSWRMNEPHTISAARPCIAMIHVVPTPYWMHFHRRIVSECPEIDLRVAYTHDVAEQSWKMDASQDVNAVSFGGGKPWLPKKPVQITIREWNKAGRIIRWLRAQQPAAVVLAGYSDAGRVRLIESCHRRGWPLFLHGDSNIHGDRFTGLKQRVKRVLVKRVVSRCTGVLPFGSAGRQFYLRYGASAEQIFYVPGEPDYSVIERVTSAEVETVRARYSFGAERRRFVFSGRLITLKRVADLIDGFVKIAERRSDWDLVIVGDGPLKEELQARVPDVLRDRVRWCGFIAEAATLGAVYRACDVLVLPSDEDAWALVVNEAMAAGMTVVVSDVVGAAEDLVRDRESGRKFPRGDVDALAEALLDVSEPANLDRYKSESVKILNEWRQRGDPVEGLRAALRWAGVLTGASASAR